MGFLRAGGDMQLGLIPVIKGLIWGLRKAIICLKPSKLKTRVKH